MDEWKEGYMILGLGLAQYHAIWFYDMVGWVGWMDGMEYDMKYEGLGYNKETREQEESCLIFHIMNANHMLSGAYNRFMKVSRKKWTLVFGET